MRVASLHRYPVKSMLGEQLAELDIRGDGVAGDRRYAVLDTTTGRVATAKNARLWRRLLQCGARSSSDGVTITLPDGVVVEAEKAEPALAEFFGRPLRLIGERAVGTLTERPAADQLLAEGVEAELPVTTFEVGKGLPAHTFADLGPVHLISTATVAAIGVEVLRYRANIVVESGGRPYEENAWVGREISVGEVVLRGFLPTPRCALPTLEHGELPRSRTALHTPAAENMIEVPGFGRQPCAGIYAEVVVPGVVGAGDPVRVGPPA